MCSAKPVIWLHHALCNKNVGSARSKAAIAGCPQLNPLPSPMGCTPSLSAAQQRQGAHHNFNSMPGVLLWVFVGPTPSFLLSGCSQYCCSEKRMPLQSFNSSTIILPVSTDRVLQPVWASPSPRAAETHPTRSRPKLRILRVFQSIKLSLVAAIGQRRQQQICCCYCWCRWEQQSWTKPATEQEPLSAAHLESSAPPRCCQATSTTEAATNTVAASEARWGTQLASTQRTGCPSSSCTMACAPAP